MAAAALRAVSAAAATGLAVLSTAVAVDGGVAGDSTVLKSLASTRALDPAARVVDVGTGYAATAAAALLLVLALLLTDRRSDAVRAGLGVAVAIGGTTLLKALLQRPRPELLPAGADVSTFSFPSGHATASAAVGAVLVLAALGTRWAPAAVSAAVALVVPVAGAQLVLGLHHPSDVVAGWLWSMAATTAIWSVGQRPADRPG